MNKRKTVSKRGRLRSRKAQSALEYLLIYSWAIVLVAVVAAVIYLFVFAPSLVTPSSCVFATGAYCQDLIFGSNSVASGVAMFLTNTQEYAIAYPQVQANFSGFPTVVGSCQPTLVLAGGAIICSVNLPQKSISLGSLVTGKIVMSAIPCPSSNAITCQNGKRQSFVGSFNAHVSPLTGTTTKIVLVSSNIMGVANGNRYSLIAHVTLLGTPIAGATVSFTESNTFATLAPSASTSDANGNATSYISSQVAGNTLVTASFRGKHELNPRLFRDPCSDYHPDFTRGMLLSESRLSRNASEFPDVRLLPVPGHTIDHAQFADSLHLPVNHTRILQHPIPVQLCQRVRRIWAERQHLHRHSRIKVHPSRIIHHTILPDRDVKSKPRGQDSLSWQRLG